MHTPGPWIAKRAAQRTDGEFDFGIAAEIDGRKLCIAEAFGRAAIDCAQPAEANARLIAAAPDMLAALDRAETIMMIVVPRSDIEEYREALKMVTAAILKATGAAK